MSVSQVTCNKKIEPVENLIQHPDTSVKLSYELGKITFSKGKPKLTPGEVSTFQGF